MQQNIKITRYRENLKGMKTVSLIEELETMRTETDEYRVGTYRFYLEQGIQDDKSLHAIPLLIFSGTYKKKDECRLLEHYNGIIAVKFDRLASIEEAANVRNAATEALQTFAAFIGVDGKSVVILCRFSLPDGTLPTDAEHTELFHAHAYRRAVLFYTDLLQREVVAKEASIDHPCRKSWDEDVYINPEAAVIPMQQPFSRPTPPTYKETIRQEDDPLLRLMPGFSRSSIISTLYENCFRKALEEHEVGDTGEGMKSFLICLAETCFKSGIPEEDVTRWTISHTGFRPHADEIGLTVHNVYDLAKNFGNKPCISKEQSLVYQLQEFLKRRFDIRYNLMKMDVEYRERRSFSYDFLPLDERGLNSISIRAHKEGINVWDKDVKRYTFSDAIPMYHPIDDYLFSLPEWNGKDYIRRLANTIPCDNPNWSNLFYKWFVSMVAHWIKPNGKHANSVSPLLVGHQGCGKSTWCRNLIPKELQDYYTDSFELSSKRKVEMALSRFALINIDEFDSIGNNQHAYLKHVLQKPTVNTTAPYQSAVRNYKRYASFIGTSNNFDLLTDPTGSRRFVCIEVTADIDNSQIVNHEQLYAQALDAVRKGEQYWYSREEEHAIMSTNEQFQQEAVEEQLFNHYFRIPEKEEQGEWLSAIAIMQEMQQKSKVNIGNKRIIHFGRILHMLNVESRRTRNGSLYLVVRK